MFTMETTNLSHFQLYMYIQIMHDAVISQYYTGSHMSRSLLYWMSPDWKFYCTTTIK